MEAFTISLMEFGTHKEIQMEMYYKLLYVVCLVEGVCTHFNLIHMFRL